MAPINGGSKRGVSRKNRHVALGPKQYKQEIYEGLQIPGSPSKEIKLKVKEVPVADLEMCRQMREAEEAAEVAVEKAAATEQTSSIADVKPEFGTPEFWAWARKRRAEANAERATKGLPPLLTAAQKAKAKALKETQSKRTP